MECDDNSDVSTSRNISPMECDYETDTNQTSGDSWLVINKTKEDSSVPSSFQNPSTTLNTDTCIPNTNQPPDDKKLKISTLHDESLPNNQSAVTGTECQMSVSSSCKNYQDEIKHSHPVFDGDCADPRNVVNKQEATQIQPFNSPADNGRQYEGQNTYGPEKPKSTGFSHDCSQKKPITQKKTFDNKEPNSKHSTFDSHKQTQNYQDEMKPVFHGEDADHENMSRNQHMSQIQSSIYSVDSSKPYEGQNNEHNSNGIGMYSTFYQRAKPDIADHEDLSRNRQSQIQSNTSHDKCNSRYVEYPDLNVLQPTLCTIPKHSETGRIIHNSSTGSTQLHQARPRIPNPNLKPWPFKTNEIPPYPVNDLHYPIHNLTYPVNNLPYPVDKLPYPVDNQPYPVNNQSYPVNDPAFASTRYQPVYNSMLSQGFHNNPMEPIGPQHPNDMRQYGSHPYPGHHASGSPNLEHQHIQGGSRQIFNPQTSPAPNAHEFTGGQPYYDSTNMYKSQNEAQNNIPSRLGQTNAMVEQHGSFTHGSTTNINQQHESPKVYSSSGEVQPVSSDLRRDAANSESNSSPPKMDRNIHHSDKVLDPEVSAENNDKSNMARKDSLDEVQETKGNKTSDCPVKKDETRSVLIETNTDQLNFDGLKFALINKKKGGGPIETLKYDPVKKQYLATFEDSRDANRIVNTKFQVAGVCLKTSLYWEDPENFVKEQRSQSMEVKQKKPQNLKIEVQSSNILRIKHILQNDKILGRFYRRLKLNCEFKSVKQLDSKDYLIVFELLEFTEDFKGKSDTAADILNSLCNDLVQTTIPVPPGINLKLEIKTLDKESKDVSVTCSGQKIYVVSKKQEMVNDFEKKIQEMIKELQDEMARKNEEIGKISIQPVVKKFLQRFLLESEELKSYQVSLMIDEDGVSLRGQSSNINDARMFILEKLEKVISQEIYDLHDPEYQFLKERKYIDLIENSFKERTLKVCIGVKKEEIVIISLQKHDISEAKAIVKESISSQSLQIATTKFLTSSEWQTLVSDIKNEHGSEVIIQTDSTAKKMTIVGVPSVVNRVSGQIEDFLESITETTDVVSADVTKMDYIRRYCYNKVDEIQKICGLTIICDQLPWTLKGTKTAVERGKSSVISVIEDIKTDTVIMKYIGIGTLFTQQRGTEIISRIGEDSNCLIIEGNKRLSTGTFEGPPPLGKWTLETDKKIEVVKTDMRYLSCDAIVNAANSLLKHGSGLAGAIVQKGGYEIQAECDKYVRDNGDVKVGEVMVGSSGKLHCKKIIHAVGPIWRKGSKQQESYLKNAILNSLKAADENNLRSIAIPAISTGIFGYPLAEACQIIVKTIVVYLLNPKNKVSHVLLCDIKEDSLMAFMTNLKSELGEQDGVKVKEKFNDESLGAVGGASASDESNDGKDEESNPDASDSDDDEGDLQSSNETDSVRSKIIVKSGEITKQQVDVIVNCTSGELDLKSGAVSRAILEAAGSSIQSECDKKYSGGIPPGNIAVTTGGKLKCKKIYHTCIVSYAKDKSQAKKSLETSISNCLQTVTRSGFKSVAFPALGCGRLGFPADVSANSVFKQTEEYLKNNPGTSLKEIIFTIHPKDTPVLKAYAEIGKDFNVSTVTKTSTKRSDGNGKVSYGKIDVEICQGDLTKESTDCIVNVCTNSMELKYGISKLISEKGGPEIAEECSKHKHEIKKDGIVITGSGKLPCSSICHLLIQKTSEDWTKIIKNALYKINKDGSASVSIPAIGTGGLKVQPKTSAEFIMRALKSYGEKVRDPKLTKVRIVIYQKEHVSEFLKVFSVDYKKHSSNSSIKGRGHRQFNRKPKKDMNEITLTIYSDKLANISEAKTKLEKRFSDEMETKKIPQYLQDIIEKLSPEQMEELKDIADNFYVKLKYDKSRKEINLIGLTKQVRDCCDQIVERLQGWKSSHQKSSEKAILSKYVDWVYEEKSGEKTHSFGPGISAKLEKAKIEKLKEIEISDHKGRKYTVNLKEMKEYSKHGSVKVYRIEKGGTRGSKLLKGEKEALSGNKTVYFSLKPKRSYDDSKPEENHFRLAESQFCRLLNNSGQYCVTEVQYVVNPVLNKKFRAAQQELKASLGEDSSLPVLAFHGTDVSNITSICENGFKKQGDSGFSQTHGAKYGHGVYFSEFPDYSIRYIKGATKLLLCQVLIGKSYTCTSLRGSNGQVEPGFDSHISSDKKELVIFKTERILPCYIVHYTQKSGDYQYNN